MSAKRPTPRSSITEIAAYVPGSTKALGQHQPSGKVFKLSSNESPIGPSAKALEALHNLPKLEDYPDGSATGLRQAIADVYGLNPERILCGAGSDEILSLVANTYLGDGDEAIYSEHGFLMYRIAILAAGGTPIVASEREQTAQVDEILSKVTDRTRIVFLANPNNPTGTYLPFDEVKRLHSGLPSDCILLLDAAYAEYVRRNDYESGLELVAAHDNVIMTRTFSKIYGLANLRLGWCFAPAHMIDAMNRIRGPFNVNGAALIAGEAAIRDTAHVDAAVAHNDEWLNWVTEQCEVLGLRVTPSVGNFALIHFPNVEGKGAAEADLALQANGCVLRRVTGYGFPNALRMSIGTEEANRATIETLKAFLDQ